MTLQSLLSKFQKVKKSGDGSYLVVCPSHADRNPSLHISLKDGKILLKCHAGCDTSAILSSVGLEMTDLFLDEDKETPQTPPRIVETYDYKDETGNLLYQVVRYEPKSFKQRHKNGDGEWVWNLDGCRRVLYQLRDILPENTVYLCEGEKDADNLWIHGKPATTSPGGANNWKPEYADYLKGKEVVIIPDNDTPGYQYARSVVKSLEGKASTIRVIALPGDYKDISDWLKLNEVEGLDKLQQGVEVLFAVDKPKYYSLSEDTIAWDKSIQEHRLRFTSERLADERTGIHSRISIWYDDTKIGWTYLNIEKSEERIRLANASHSIIKGDFAKVYNKEDLRADLDNFCGGLWNYQISSLAPEEMGGDTDNTPLTFLCKPYILEGGGTILYAPPGRGKSFSGLLWAVAVDSGCDKFWHIAKRKVLFINLERSRRSLMRRLAAVNRVFDLPPNRPLLTMNARGKSLMEVKAVCRKSIKDNNVGLVVLDSISRAGYGDLTNNEPMNKVIDALSALCSSWLALGHTARANEGHVYGSIMQEAGADICVELASQILDEGRLLGIGWRITKSNDVGNFAQSIYALEFDQETGLQDVRPARSYEFPDIEANKHEDILTAVINYVQNLDSGDATATEIEEALGYKQWAVSRLFNQSGKFVETRRVKRSVYYGVKSRQG